MSQPAINQAPGEPPRSQRDSNEPGSQNGAREAVMRFQNKFCGLVSAQQQS